VANERLRDAMQCRCITPVQLAKELEIDPKTVERWITSGREPYPKNRHAVAALLGEHEQYLWPSAGTDTRSQQASESEVVKVYPYRGAVPNDLWDRLLRQADSKIDILVYVGMFLTENPGLLKILETKGAGGTNIRMLFGARDSHAVIQRSLDEGIGRNTISAKIDHALAHFQPIGDLPGIEVRTHETVLYNSIYRFDDEMLVNPHVYGKIASHSPAIHLRRLSAGNFFTTYLDSFDDVWNQARRHSW
jgi:hypothetical protein